MAYTPFKFPQQPTVQQTLSRTPGYFGQLNPQNQNPFSLPPMKVPTGTQPTGYNPRGMLPSATPNAMPRNQKAAIIMGALSDIFRGQDPTQNTIARQQQMVAMQERAKQQQAMQKLRSGQPFTQADMIDILGAKDYMAATMGTNKGTSLMQNTGYIDDLYAQRDALPENDPMRQRLDMMIRNAEAQAGAGKYDPYTQFALAESKRIGGSTAGLDLSPYELEVDKAFAKEAVEFETTGKWTAITNIEKLDQSIAALKESDNLTGPVIGNTPRALLAITNPEAVGLEDDIRSIIFQSLKATLGAQFTEREGDRLVAASFNQLLPEEVNMKRLERIRNETFNSIKAMEDKIKYNKRQKTLRGYEGEQSVDSLINAIIKPEDYAGLSDDQLMTIFKDPNTSEAELNAIRKLIGG
jgi:hypothetical protein